MLITGWTVILFVPSLPLLPPSVVLSARFEVFLLPFRRPRGPVVGEWHPLLTSSQPSFPLPLLGEGDRCRALLLPSLPHHRLAPLKAPSELQVWLRWSLL